MVDHIKPSSPPIESTTLYPKEKEVLRKILDETIFKNVRSVDLPLADIAKSTGIPRSTVASCIKRLEKRKLITVENFGKTNRITPNIKYKEIMF